MAKQSGGNQGGFWTGENRVEPGSSRVTNLSIRKIALELLPMRGMGVLEHFALAFVFVVVLAALTFFRLRCSRLRQGNVLLQTDIHRCSH
jgi:hypothetical protein